VINICILNPAAELGGAERSLLELLRHIAGKDLLITVILPRKGPLAEKLSELGVACQIVPMPAAILGMSRRNLAGSVLSTLFTMPALLLYLVRLRRALIALNCAVIYTNGIKSHIAGSAVSCFCGCRLVWHVRDIVKKGPFLRFLRLCSIRADKIIYNSNFTAASFRGRLSPKDTVIYNGFNRAYFTDYAADPLEFRNKYGIPESSVLCGTMGVLTRGKGLEVLIDAAVPLLEKHRNLSFMITGDDIYDTPEGAGCRARLERLVEDKGLSPHFVFTGFLEDIRPCLSALDIFIMPSVAEESFGRSAIEAMLSKKPVIASGIGALPELIEDGISGLLVTPSSPGALVNAIDNLLRDGELRKNIALEGFLRAKTAFPVEKYASSVEKVFLGLMTR